MVQAATHDHSTAGVRAGSEADQSTLAYRPHLDGLRALAVYLVVAFHAGSQKLLGGFIGVDVFFVLSGFLVTRTLLRDVDLSGGSVQFRRFYLRRVRRLLPAALVNLVVTAVVFSAFATPAELAAASDSIRSAALWYSNWHFIGVGADYFAAEIESSPVAHYWSLSVEEQFYLLWPLALAAILAVSRRLKVRRETAIGAVVAVGVVASAAAAVVVATSDVDRAYYGTDTRAYQILIGAALALVPGLIARAAASRGARKLALVGGPLLLAALVLVASSAVDVDPVTRGLATAAVAVLLIAALEVAPAGPAGRFLAQGPLVYLGRISYGTYLWHWLVILVIDDAFALSSLSKTLLTALVASALASLSMELVERPIRTWTLPPRFQLASISTGVVASVLVATLVVPAVFDRSDAESNLMATATASVGGTPAQVDVAAEKRQSDKFDVACMLSGELCQVRRGTGQTVLLLGDSHAGRAAAMVLPVADAHDLSFYASSRPGCPWVRSIAFTNADACFAGQDELFDEALPSLDPDIVILVHRPILDRTNPIAIVDADLGPVTAEPERERLLAERTEETIRQLRSSGVLVVIIEPVPVAPVDFDPAACMARADVIEECRYLAQDGPTAQEVVFRKLAAADEGVWSVDLDRAVCPYLPICDPVVNGAMVKLDEDHIGLAFGATLGAVLDSYLVDSGVLD